MYIHAYIMHACSECLHHIPFIYLASYIIGGFCLVRSDYDHDLLCTMHHTYTLLLRTLLTWHVQLGIVIVAIAWGLCTLKDFLGRHNA